MEYLHVAVIDENECFVSYTELELRQQVSEWLLQNSLIPPTDEEWAVCILAEEEKVIPVENPALGIISYYKTVLRLKR